MFFIWMHMFDDIFMSLIKLTHNGKEHITKQLELQFLRSYLNFIGK